MNRLNWREFLSKPNPVASALMTKMKIAEEDRPRVKLECLRMLVTLKLDPARAELITVFMKSYLKLTSAEVIVYDRYVEAIEPGEKEVVMKYVNEWTEQGLLEGQAKGLIAGRVEGQAGVIIRQLRRRFGELPADLPDAIHHLDSPQLDDLAEALLDFNTLADAPAWLAKA